MLGQATKDSPIITGTGLPSVLDAQQKVWPASKTISSVCELWCHVFVDTREYTGTQTGIES